MSLCLSVCLSLALYLSRPLDLSTSLSLCSSALLNSTSCLLFTHALVRQIRLGLHVADIELRHTYLKESVLLLLSFVRQTLFCKRCRTMLSGGKAGWG